MLILLSCITYLLGVTLITSNLTDITDIILTGINAFIAYLTASYTHKSAEYQKQAVTEERQRDQSGQASKVYAHMIQKLIESGVTEKLDKVPYQPVLIGNSSNEPIYDVYVISFSNRSNLKILKRRYMELKKYRSDPDSFIHYFVHLNIVMPGIFYRVIETRGGASGGEKSVATIFFTDSRGTKWIRDAKGTLQILPKHFDVCRFCHINPTDVVMPCAVDLNSYDNLKNLYEKHPVKKFKR